jgi:SAM-dependent methyltransferase
MPIRPRSSGDAAVAAANPPLTGRSERAERLAAQSPQQQYAGALHRHLAGMPQREIDFFVNPRRMEMLERLAGQDLRAPGAEILNAACGPFALEFYLGLSAAHITSFDREERLQPLHRELTNRRLILQSNFKVADVYTFTTPQMFDVVLINDLFYSRYIDFYTLLPKYAAFVKPGGLLYFDIQDQRAGPLWRAFRKDAEFRRYDLDDVARVLRDAGFSIEACEPALGIKGGLDGVVRKAMWGVASLANSYVFVARKI